MVELVLGLGARKSVLEVFDLCDQQLRKSQGYPRKITVRGHGLELVALREDFEHPYADFTFNLGKLAPDTEAKIRAIAEKNSFCVFDKTEGISRFEARPDGAATAEQARAAARDAGACLTLPEVWRVYGDLYRVDPISVQLLFQAMVEYKASDVHLAPGEAPLFRVDGAARRSDIMGALSAEQLLALLREIAADQYWDEFQRDQQTSFNFHQVGLGYSRVSAFLKGGAPHITFRFLPEKIPSFGDLNIPGETMVKLANLHHGLVLVTGMTGSGKSTTVAALVDWINSHKAVHILCIENPIEYVHVNKKSFISQRAIGTDVRDFFHAVTGALRHDPDVIVIGEMRDPDTIRSAISAAATGHLVISTLHSNTAYEVINRIVSFFDPVERDLVKLQLRDAIRCVICQRLVPKKGGGRIPALEFLFNDIKPINDGIVAGDSDAIRIGMQQTISHSFIFEEYLYKRYKEGVIDIQQARDFATDESILDQMLMGTYTVPRLDSIKAAHLGHHV